MINRLSKPLFGMPLLGISKAPNRKARRRQAQAAKGLGRAVAERVKALPARLLAGLHKNPANSLRRHAREWRRFLRQPTVRRWIARGYPLPVDTVPRRFISQPKMSTEQAVAVNAEIAKMLKSGAVRAVPAAQIQLSSPIFVVPKREKGSWRLIHDLRYLNTLITAITRFKLPGLKDLKHVARPGDWMTTWDLKSGYHHVSIDPEYHKMLGFRWNGQGYVFTVLPFGLKTAPYVFQKTMLSFAGQLRKKGFRIIVYLDDFLLIGRTEAETRRHRNVAFRMMIRLGLIDAPEKGQEPQQSVLFLGFRVDTRPLAWPPDPSSDQPRQIIQGQFALTEERLARAKQIAAALGTAAKGRPVAAPQHRRTRPAIPTHRLQSQLGFLASLRTAIPQVGLFLTRAFTSLRGTARGRRRTRIRLDPRVETDMKGLCDWLHHHPPTPIWEPTTAQVALGTDASDLGWGAALEVQGSDKPILAKGTWTLQERSLHITAKEALGLKLGVASLLPHFRGKAVQLKLDATAVIGAVQNHRSRSPRIAQIVLEVHRRLRRAGCTIVSVVYIPSEEHVLPDRLSRLKEANAWQLRHSVFASVCSQLGACPQVDRFADCNNTLLPRFNAWLADPKAEATDALAQDWSGTVSWANPPWPLLPRVVGHIVRQRAPTILLIPLWKTAVWWPALLPHIRGSVTLHKGQDLFTPQSRAYQQGVGPTKWPLMAVKLFL